jgi:hypothetical protein
MPLSRHFYSLDEVQAALLYTTSHNNTTEALFWCQELILSGCVGEAISTHFQSWLWNTGPMRLQWLIDASKTLANEELSENDILLATHNLSSIHSTKRDNSLWNILVLIAQNPNKMPDSVTRKTPHVIPSEDEKEIYLIRAMFQGKAASAWWICQFIESDRIWLLLDWFAENIHNTYYEKYTQCLDSLQKYDKLLGYKSDEYDKIVICAAVIMMCINKERQKESFKEQVSEIDRDNLQILNELDAIVGRRERRVYKIPNACLYGTTLRGRSKWTQSNYNQLYNIEKYLIGCPFWDEVLEEYADIDEQTIKWKTHDKMEEFYEKYFPDDIPDEWIKKDQQQSHGDGILGPTDKPTICKYSRNFISKIPNLAWNTSKIINKYLEEVDINDCSVERIIQHYQAPHNLTQEDLKKLEPVCKIKII